jgi:cytochrome b561
MKWRNDPRGYGLVAVAMHWTVAVGVFGLFALGLYMRTLTYYDPLYRVLPQWHKDIGFALILLVLLRLAWRVAGVQPAAEPGHRRWERAAAHAAHALLYLLPFAMLASGYLISTADGRPMVLWVGVLELPALVTGIDNLEDTAGTLHELLAYGFIGLAVLHAAGAVKHHFFDRDRTLLRMLGR